MIRRCWNAIVPAMLIMAATAVIGAQVGQKPAFEVASVRPATPRTPQSQRITETRLDIVNTQLRFIVMRAFRVEQFQFVGPAWLNDAYFDIHATYPAGAQAQVPEMLQALLGERFGLVAHIEPRPVPAYELVVGKDGLKIREVESANDVERDFSADPRVTASTDRSSQTFDGTVRTMMIPLGGRTVTSRSSYDTWTTAQRTFMVDATRITMPEFAKLLTSNVDRPVVDKTGLGGVYQFKVELGANQSAVRGLLSLGITKTVNGTPIDEPVGVSTFKAVESLGLKLEERRSPFDVLVVDKMEQVPREN